VHWLAGRTSGKLFMDWQGAARVGFSAALALLAVVLGAGLVRRWPREGRAGRAWRLALLLALLPVPGLMAWAASPRLYPTINPDSGGATGSSLLGSTLVLVGIFLFTPRLLDLPRRTPASPAVRAIPWLLAPHFALYAFVERGDSSHHSVLQIVGLFSLWIWPPLLVVFLRGVLWPEGARRWLFAFAAWGIFLTVSACLMFLPGWLDRGKFTQAFVGHTHAAMAGMLTSYLMLVLLCLNPGRIAAALGAPRAFVVWQTGCLLHVAALMLAGGLEGARPGILFSPNRGMDALMILRAVAGLAMLEASARWWRLVQPQRPLTPAPEFL
jgi:cytochrome c oxidase cbb3-type subunit I